MFHFSEEREIISIDFSILNTKWLFLGIYNPPSQNETLFVEQIKLALNTYSTTHESFLLLGDFNMTTENSKLQDLMDAFCLENLIKEPTCFKSTVPTTIDLIVTNQKSLFMKSSAYESGLSDFHKLTTTILRKSITKGNPRNILYRDYKIFDQKKFEDQLRSQLASIKTVDYSQFHEIFLKTLDAIAPIKKKILCFNHNPFMSKALRKAVMVSSNLENKYNKNRTGENWDSYKKRNFCVKLLRKTKKGYFNNLNIKNINDNKAFWKIIKLYFSNEGLNSSSFILLEKNKIVTNDQDIANMNNYFLSITSHINIKPGQINYSKNLTIENLKNHESIQRIALANFRHRQTFNFRYVSVKEVKKELMNLSSKKVTRKGDIPAKILKDSLSVYTKELTTIINNCLKDGLFPNELKLADVSPVFKKDDDLNKENYRPVSILSHMSKVFERIFYKQIDRFMTSKFSPFLCGFRKNHNSQYSLLKMMSGKKS